MSCYRGLLSMLFGLVFLTWIGPPTLAQEGTVQEETKTAAEAQDSDEEEKEEAEEEPKLLTRAEFSRLYREKKNDELLKRVDEALLIDPEAADTISMNLSLVSVLLGRQKEEALERLQIQFESLMAMDELAGLNKSNLARAAVLVAGQSEMESEAKLQLLDDVLEKIEADSPYANSLKTAKCRLLVEADRTEDAWNLFTEAQATALDVVESGDYSRASSLLTAWNNVGQVLAAERREDVAAAMSSVESQLTERYEQLEEPDVKFFRALAMVRQYQLMRLVSNDPEQAEEVLAKLKADIEELREQFEDDRRSLATLDVTERSLSMVERRVESELKMAKLIGMQAPEIDAVEFVAMEPVTMEELAGKVVLIDFWAVWCGPCIATFPHLIEFQEEFGDKGLVILGATKYYNYEWDEEAGRAMRGKEVPPEAELEMLAKFREHHELQHGFFVTPEGSDYWTEFGVRGIPQAVLIDQEGKVVMVKVGSGSGNAEALHSKIEELLH